MNEVFAQQSAYVPIETYFNRLPPMVVSPDEAYSTYYPKNKVTPCQQYIAVLRQQLAELADESAGKSRLLSMLAGRYDAESEHTDFAKITINKDGELDAAVKSANTAFFTAMDDAARKTGQALDSVSKLYSGLQLIERALEIHRRELSALTRTVWKQLQHVESIMKKKGYDTILAKGKVSHPYYIQLLELKD